MRTLIFSTAYLPFVGGAELAIQEITDRLSPTKFSFDLITLNLDGKQKREERIGNVRVLRLSCPKFLFPFAAFMRASRLHRKEPYTHIWSVMASYGGFAGLFFKHHFPSVPFILTLQEGDSFAHIYRRVFFVWPLFKMMFTRADHITAISNYLAKWAKRMGAKANVTVIPNGVDVGNFQFPRLPIGGQAISNFQTSPDVQKQEIKQRLGLKPEDKVVITTSRLVEKNGVGDLIEAMRYLPENIKLLILGTGNLESNLKLKTSNLQLTGRVAFLGYIAHEKLPEYLHASDIFVRASRSEGLGISFLEAMAAGVPVVATPVGGIPDFLFSAREDILPSPARENRGVRKTNPAPTKDERVSRIGTSPMGEARVRMSSGAGVDRYGETGLFCRVGDPKDIAEKMKLLLTNDELRNRIVENASKVVKERYEWGKIAKQMEAVLHKFRNI